MRTESEIISRKYEIKKEAGKAVVMVTLAPSIGRERIVTIRTSDVRAWLENQENIKLGAAIEGGSFNNNMSSRLGSNKTAADLRKTYIFEIVQEEKVEEPVVKVQEAPAPKKTRRSRTSSKAKTTASTKAKATVTKETETEVKADAVTTTEAKPEVKKTTRRRTRKKPASSTTTTTTVADIVDAFKGDD